MSLSYVFDLSHVVTYSQSDTGFVNVLQFHFVLAWFVHEIS